MYFNSAISPASSRPAAAISRKRSLGIDAPPMSVVSLVHSGRGNGCGSAPQMPVNSATPINPRPTVTSTCSMCRWYSGRIRKNSTAAPMSAPTAMPMTIASGKAHPPKPDIYPMATHAA